MTAAIIAVSRPLPGSVDIPDTQIRQGPDRRMPREEFLRFIRDASILITWVSERVDPEALDAAGPGLKGVCNFAVGTDNIDLKACRARGITVTNTPNAVTEGTADLAWALILGVARRLVPADRFARSAEYGQRGPLGPTEFMGTDLTGRTLLIVGAGRIGFAVALRSIGWGMRVLYTARQRHWEFELAPLAAQKVELEEGLRRADVVSLHCPLTDETRGLIGERELSLMKPTAILINTARGPVVKEAELAAALKAGRIYGAGLDVFEREPQVHPDLIGLDNCTLTPHIGSAADRYRKEMTAMVSANARAILTGKEPPNRVA